MTADFRLTAIPVDPADADVRRVSLDRSWVASLAPAGFPMRTADIGVSVLVTVAVLSSTELRRVNVHARANANNARCCDAVDTVLEWAGELSYYSPWFVVESADID